MGKKPKREAAFLAFDVGKSSHRACAVDEGGEVLFNREVANRPADVDRALAEAGPGARVVVDQKRNIGALVVARARAAGNPVSYLPGLAMKKARDMLPVTAKTDAIDAEVIARTAAGMPWTLREVAEETPASASLRMLAAQRDFAVASRTRAANRLRAVLLEADPAFEAQVDPSSRWQLAVLAELGGPFGIRGAGLRRFRSVAERGGGAKRAAADRLWAAAAASASSGRPELAAESELVRSLAARVAADSAEAARLDALISDSLAGDRTYEALLTVPGVGPKTAAALVTLVDVSLFRGHDELAAYTGLAPCNRQSGSSLNSSSPSRGGNRTLKNLLIYSCTSLVGTDNRYGRYYDACRARGMRHNKALKAVARKRLKAIYAIMRDGVPYREG